jgi:hypothetical protein
MKNYILVIVLLLLYVAPSSGQMSVAKTYPSSCSPDTTGCYNRTQIVEIVDLSLSGKKIEIYRQGDGFSVPDTLFYYNMDYSFWKMIPVPLFPNRVPGPVHNGPVFGSNFYASETLFNTDSLLEVAVFYNTYLPATRNGVIYIINENGLFTDSLTHLNHNGTPYFEVHQISSTNFIATALNDENGIEIINLPGTLPCESCANAGIVDAKKPNSDFLSSPIPNPSKDQVKITFTLPDGTNRGELTIYSTEGKKMKSYTVDNRFGFIMVDDSQFPPGMYYYNLTVNGEISSSQKMVVIR